MRNNRKKGISRRGFGRLVGAGVVTAAGWSTLSSSCKVDGPSESGKSAIPIGVQLYSVRRECEKDFPGTLEAVAAMGYAGVEFAGYYEHSAQQLREMLDGNGLQCCGTHLRLDSLLGDEFQKTVDFNLALGNKYLIVPSLPEERRSPKEKVLETAALFNELAEKLHPHGLRVGYHNHDWEFSPMNGEVFWDLFFTNTGTEVVMQMDVGNAILGGADPLEYFKRYPGRAATVHVKEYSRENPEAFVGEGDVNWKEVFALLESQGGTEWYIVEYEHAGQPPLESIDKCLQNLRKMSKN